MLEMNDIILIFIGIFIILLIFLFFILVAYVYDTYTSYKIDINDNLAKSEDYINDATKSINSLKDNVNTDITKIKTTNDSIEQRIKNNYDAHETKYNTFTSNLNHLVNIDNIKENNIGSNLFLNNITAYDRNTTDLNLLTNFNMWEDTIVHTSSNNSNYFNICDSATGNKSNLTCASLNIDNNKVFNIFSSNTNYNSSNVDKIRIGGKLNTNTMMEFDINNNNILLGSNVSPAISIKNNIYTPPIITGKYSISGTESTGNINLDFFTNIDIPTTAFVNFYIPTTQTISLGTQMPDIITNATYSSETKILKFKNTTTINANVTTTIRIPITGTGASITSENNIQINGYLTSS